MSGAPETRRARWMIAASVAAAFALAAAAALLVARRGGEPGSVEVPDAGGPPAPEVFIAFARDFRGFRSWERHRVEGAMLPVGISDGPTAVYLNRRPPAGSARWPVGTILVKVIESGPAPHEWVIHAMVKRGVPFNRDGATGWEYFELAFPEGGSEPVVVWRGLGPPSGHGYAARGRDAGADPIPLVCNDCHAAAWQDDGVLSEAYSLRERSPPARREPG